ncbi:MAG: hypothetical protein H7836_17605 [Magnetococcus sp. YQC-3]
MSLLWVRFPFALMLNKHFEFYSLTLGVIVLGLFMVKPTITYGAVIRDTFANIPVSTSTLSTHYTGEGGGSNYLNVYGGAPGTPTLAFCESGDSSSLNIGPFYASAWANATSSGATLNVPSGMTMSTTTEGNFIRTDYYGATVLKSDFGNPTCQFGSGGAWSMTLGQNGSRFVNGFGDSTGSTGWNTINNFSGINCA